MSIESYYRTGLPSTHSEYFSPTSLRRKPIASERLNKQADLPAEPTQRNPYVQIIPATHFLGFSLQFYKPSTYRPRL